MCVKEEVGTGGARNRDDSCVCAKGWRAMAAVGHYITSRRIRVGPDESPSPMTHTPTAATAELVSRSSAHLKDCCLDCGAVTARSH